MRKYISLAAVGVVVTVGVALWPSVSRTSTHADVRVSQPAARTSIFANAIEVVAAEQARVSAARRLARHDRPHAFD
jgi:hypothetical protein